MQYTFLLEEDLRDLNFVGNVFSKLSFKEDRGIKTYHEKQHNVLRSQFISVEYNFYEIHL
jgi:hypothetical protein